MTSPRLEVLFFYDASTGAPLTGLSPSFTSYRNDLGTSLTPPTITEIGGGAYGFTPVFSDPARAIAYVAYGGSGSAPRYSRLMRSEDWAADSATATFESPKIEVFTFYSASTGLPLSGLTPTFSTYKNSSGTTLSTPTISAVGASGVYKFTPSFADPDKGIVYIVDGGATANPRYHARYVRPEDWNLPTSTTVSGTGYIVTPGSTTGTATRGATLDSVASALARGLAAPPARDLAIDLDTKELILHKGDLQLTYEVDAIAQAALVRLSLFEGEWFLDQTVGVPYYQSILVKSPDLQAIQSIFSSEILKVEGVRNVRNCLVELNRSNRRLTVKWTADTDTGELRQSTTLNVGVL